ncbi:transglycosylase family protein [Streptomyces sp. 7N604]|uniref:transglycosylase family protein n=1 Tax=Streptomyces sp. 7N604 TaxID=3457415 RepID=UPI003FD3CB67
MRSGTGRHRRPRQAPAIFVAAGVTGSAIAMPLLAASGAQAADTDTWDRVAQCESGGMWSADTGNGYFGGLQFTQETWEQYGGRDYAPSADLASRAQQISVAEKVLAVEGPEAWPNCATNAGLTEDGADPDVNPGIDLPGTADSLVPDSGDQAPTDGRDEADGASGSGSDGRTEDRTGGSADSGEPSGGSYEKPDGSGASTPAEGSGTGKHRGKPADEELQDGRGGDAGAGAEGREDGGHASRGGDSGRAGKGGDYTVRPGDSLSEIAEEHSLDGGWPALYETNEAVVGGDPDLIHPGQQLQLS